MLALAESAGHRWLTQQSRYLARYSVCGKTHRLVNMDIALGYAARGMSEEGRNRQFGEAEIAGNTGKCVPQRMRCYTLNLGTTAQSVQHPDQADEMAISPIRRKNVG